MSRRQVWVLLAASGLVAVTAAAAVRGPEVELLNQECGPGALAQGGYVLRTDAEVREFWQVHCTSAAPLPLAGGSVVLYYFAGPIPHCCARLTAHGLASVDGTGYVEVVEHRPGWDCVVLPMITGSEAVMRARALERFEFVHHAHDVPCL